MRPTVTVIGISYNHGLFIKEALDSIWAQSYEPIQLILLDDASKDNSQQVIRDCIKNREEVQFIGHTENQGYTRTFNEGLSLAKGDYIVDFALDDVMLPDFIEKSVSALESAGKTYGVSSTNANYINAESKVIGNHLETLHQKGMIKEMPQGDIFEMILKRYFICTPTMMIRKQVFDRIGGYDETLAYEDFDFWVRSSRYFNYTYVDEVLMNKRKLQTSMSANRMRHWQNEQLNSVYQVCEKAFALCKSKSELKALRERLAYEYRQSLRAEHSTLAGKYLRLLRKTGGSTLLSNAFRLLSKLGVNLRRT